MSRSFNGVQIQPLCIFDPKSNEQFYVLEANQRLTNDLKINLELRLFEGAGANDDTFVIRDEDYFQVELVKFF